MDDGMMGWRMEVRCGQEIGTWTGSFDPGSK